MVDRGDDPATRADFIQLRAEWEAWKLAQALRWDTTSINDVKSTSATERLVTFNDSQRVQLNAVLVNQDTRDLLAAIAGQRRRFWDTTLGKVSTVVGIIAALVLIFTSLYGAFYGLSHSIVPH